MPSIEESYLRAMAAWRGNVSEETMAGDLLALALAVHEDTLDLLEEVLDDPQYGSALAVVRYVLSGVEERIEKLGR